MKYDALPRTHMDIVKDFTQNYLKVTNDKEYHRGYQYKDGFNQLEEKFESNPKKSCCLWRVIYFYTRIHI